jgi:hypothetical protein
MPWQLMMLALVLAFMASDPSRQVQVQGAEYDWLMPQAPRNGSSCGESVSSYGSWVAVGCPGDESVHGVEVRKLQQHDRTTRHYTIYFLHLMTDTPTHLLTHPLMQPFIRCVIIELRDLFTVNPLYHEITDCVLRLVQFLFSRMKETHQSETEHGFSTHTSSHRLDNLA